MALTSLHLSHQSSHVLSFSCLLFLHSCRRLTSSVVLLCRWWAVGNGWRSLPQAGWLKGSRWWLSFSKEIPTGIWEWDGHNVSSKSKSPEQLKELKLNQWPSMIHILTRNNKSNIFNSPQALLTCNSQNSMCFSRNCHAWPGTGL